MGYGARNWQRKSSMHQVDIILKSSFILKILFWFFSSSNCEFSTGVLPFNSLNPQDFYFEPYVNYFWKPIKTLSEAQIGDTIKIFCVQEGKLSLGRQFEHTI